MATTVAVSGTSISYGSRTAPSGTLVRDPGRQMIGESPRARAERATCLPTSPHSPGRVPPLPASPAGCPGSDRFRGQPHRHIAASNEGLIVGWPVRNAVLRLIRGMNLRLHPCSVAPAEGPEKCGPRRPTPAGSSCNNAQRRGHDGQVKQSEQEVLHARDSVGQTSGATQRCLNPGVSERIGNSRRTARWVALPVPNRSTADWRITAAVSGKVVRAGIRWVIARKKARSTS